MLVMVTGLRSGCIPTRDKRLHSLRCCKQINVTEFGKNVIVFAYNSSSIASAPGSTNPPHSVPPQSSIQPSSKQTLSTSSSLSTSTPSSMFNPLNPFNLPTPSLSPLPPLPSLSLPTRGHPRTISLEESAGLCLRALIFRGPARDTSSGLWQILTLRS